MIGRFLIVSTSNKSALNINERSYCLIFRAGNNEGKKDGDFVPG